MKTCVLAYSGGLDTSYCLLYLTKELEYNVHAVYVNTGGVDPQEYKMMKERAMALGASTFEVIEAEETFYQKGIKYLVFGNVLKNDAYPLSVSAERIFQATELANYANKVGADAIAHGSTGAGNDQVRFDLVFNALCPNAEVITPIRDHGLSREAEIEYLKKHGVSIDAEKAAYSINAGIWGTSVGGAETLTSHKYLPDEAWPVKADHTTTKAIELAFENGEISELNGKQSDPVTLIKQLEKLAAPYGIGRAIHVGDTIIGIKGRVGFQASAAVLIIAAHRELEKHTLSKWQLQLKRQWGDWYGMFMHDGMYLDPVMRDIEASLSSSQQNVTGKVFLTLKSGHFIVQGVESPYDLMQNGAKYGEEMSNWTSDDAKGFIKIMGNNYQNLTS